MTLLKRLWPKLLSVCTTSIVFLLLFPLSPCLCLCGPRLGSMKLHRYRRKFMKKFYHRPLRSTRLHSKQRRFQKLRIFHLWQNVGDPVRFIRCDLAHYISRILYRSVDDPIHCILRLLFRPQRLHSFGGAQVFCVLCVHFKESETNNRTPRNVRNDLDWIQLR